jgi:hypothetical protein
LKNQSLWLQRNKRCDRQPTTHEPLPSPFRRRLPLFIFVFSRVVLILCLVWFDFCFFVFLLLGFFFCSEFGLRELIQASAVLVLFFSDGCRPFGEVREREREREARETRDVRRDKREKEHYQKKKKKERKSFFFFFFINLIMASVITAVPYI